MAELNVGDYTLPVHISLMEPDRVLGVGFFAFASISYVTILLMYFVHWGFIALGVIGFVIIRILCKKDPYLFDILINSLFERDIFYA